MRRVKILCIVLVLVFLSTGCTVTINGQEIDAMNFSDFFGKVNTEIDQDVSKIQVKNHKQVEIKCASADVTIQSSKEDSVNAVLDKEVESFGNRSLIDEIILDVQDQGDKITIDVRYASGSSVKTTRSEKNGIVVKSSTIFNGLRVKRMNLKLNVTIPEQIKDIKIETSSGELAMADFIDKERIDVISASGDKKIKNIKADEMHIQSSSGKLGLENCTIPKVNITSSSGDNNLSNIKAEAVTIQSSSGRVTVDELNAGEAEIRTMSGDVKADKLKANMLLSVSSGDIHITEFEGRADLEAMSGDSTIRDSILKAGSAFKASSGDISISGKFDDTANEYKFDSMSGDITIKVPTDYAFNIDASSMSGNVDSDFSIEIDREYNKRDKELIGKVNGGGSLFRVRTGSGRISVKK